MTPVLCVGAAHWDIVGRAATPLAPGDDVPGRVVRRPGGVALNVARNLAAAGHAATLLGAVGRDADGDRLVALAESGGVDCRHLARIEGPSDVYLAIEDAAGELFAGLADCSALERAGAAILRPLRDGALASPGSPWPGAAVIDGNLPEPVLRRLAEAPELVAARTAFVAASPAKTARLAGLRPGGAIYVNRREAAAICGRSLPDAAAAARALRDLGWAEAVVTDGPAPAAHADAAGMVRAAPPPTAGGGVTGAGDVFVAAHLAAHLLAPPDARDPEAALAAALAAAARHLAAEAP